MLSVTYNYIGADQRDYNGLDKWFMKKVNTDNGLPWNEFKGQLQVVAAKHKYKPSDHDWQMIKDGFSKADKNGDGFVTPSDVGLDREFGPA